MFAESFQGLRNTAKELFVEGYVCGCVFVIVFVVVSVVVWWLRSGGEHCLATFAVEVRPGTLPQDPHS